MTNNTLVSTFTGHSEWIDSLTTFMSEDRVCLASGGQDGTIQIWELENFIHIKTLTFLDSTRIWSLNTLYDNEKNTWGIVSGHENGNIMLCFSKLEDFEKTEAIEQRSSRFNKRNTFSKKKEDSDDKQQNGKSTQTRSNPCRIHP